MVNLIDDTVVQSTLPTETPTPTITSEPVEPETAEEPLTQYEKTKLALEKWKNTSILYSERKAAADYKKSSLLIRTNWKEALPEHSRPTVSDKESYIKEVMYEKNKSLAILWTEKKFLEEMYQIEKIQLEKGDVIDG